MALFLPLWVIVGAAFLYAFLYRAFELLLIGVLLDLFFVSVAHPVPFVYTFVMGVAIVCAELLKPSLSLYATEK